MDEVIDADVVTGSGAPLRGSALNAFLNLGIVARLACLDAAGWPYAVPVWFEWDGAGFWVIATKEAGWARFLLANPRVALCIDEPESLRRVMCQGRAIVVEGPSTTGQWVDIARRMGIRYLGPRATAYAAATQHLARWLFYIEPKQLLTWEGPGRHEGRAG